MFAVEVDDLLVKLKSGEVKIERKPQLPNFENPAESARAWAQQYEQNMQLQAANEQQEKKIEKLQPKADGFDRSAITP